MKYGGKAKGKVAAYKAMLKRPGFWQAVERSTAWLGPLSNTRSDQERETPQK